MTSYLRHPSSALLFATLAVTASTAWAEEHLHERVIDPNNESSPLVEQPAEGQNPSAIRLENMQMEVSEPNHSTELRSGEQPFDDSRASGSAESHQRLRSWRPDLDTARTAEELSYHSTFNPSIAPHKRISALDRISPAYHLQLANPELREIPVGGTASEDRDLFWGSITVELVPNRPIPIPSVAPEARILSVRTRPNVPLRFHRDGADNFYVSSPHQGRVRVIFVTDAPATFFGGPLPSDVDANDVPAALRPRLPTSVAQDAVQVMQRLGLNPAAPIARNLSRLVAYIRAFRNEPLDERSSANPYLTLAFGRRGVCRHRAFVFVVTAQALGIPARFVTNEVHAFSEVYIPNIGWVRIDLGGEARLAPESNPVAHHQPRVPDFFPWPPGSESPAEARRRSGGGGGGQLARRAERESDGAEERPDPEAEAQQPEQMAEQPIPTPEAAGLVEEGSTTAEEDDPAEEPAEEPANEPENSRLLVFLERHSTEVIRGEPLTLRGRVETSVGSTIAATVTLWLRAPDSGRLIRLGQTTSGSDGRFVARFAVPGTVPTGDYSLYARAEATGGSRDAR